MQLDTTVDIATPEGVELKLPVAGLAPRSLAWLIDALIKFVALTVLTLTLRMLGTVGVGFLLLAMFALLWLYNVLFEVFNHGATPGKRALGLRVMNANGTPVGWTGSLVRNLLRFVDALPGTYAFGCVTVLVSRRFQRLGDLAADTIVIFEPRTQKSAQAIPADPLPLRLPLDPVEQQAVVSFGERAGSLSADRGEELADILEPVLPDVDRQRLCGHASWLAGGGVAR